MTKYLVIGIVQGDYGIDPIENLRRTSELLRNHLREADIVVLPEYSMVDLLAGLSPEELYSRAEFMDDSRYLSRISDLAGKYGIPILVHFIEKTSKPPKCRSSSVLVKPSGDFEWIYSKIHLFDAYGYRESDYFIPGNQLSKEILFNGFRVRIAICFDIRFPELFRSYALHGTDIVIIHSGWVRGPLKEETLEFLGRSRAHENTYWVIIANRFGEKYTGRSMFLDPFGVKVYELGHGVRYGEYTIDYDRLVDARKTIPVLVKSKEKWVIELKTEK